MPIKTLLVGVALLITLIAGILTFMLVEQAPRATAPQTAMLFADQSELPEFELLDHDGNEVGKEVFKGHWNLVFFGFTHCPDICPMTLTVLADAQRQLRERGLALPRIVLVSVAKTPSDGDNYSVDHSAVVMIIDPDGRQHGIFSSPHVAGNFVNDLPIIMARQ
jgi:protein SCO1/2